MTLINELVMEIDYTIKSLTESKTQPNNIYHKHPHHAAQKADDKIITQNIKLFNRIMEQIKKDINGFSKTSKNLTEFQEKIGIYIQSNPITTEANIQNFIKAVNGVASQFRPGLPPGGTQELVKEVIRTRTMTHLDKLGIDIQGNMRNILEESVNNQKGMRYARDEMAKNIDGMNRNRAEVIARTETGYARSQAELVKAESKGQEYFVVVSAGDCCDECFDVYDGNTFHVPEDEDMLPPLHPNCRCAATFFRTEGQAEDMAETTSKPDRD
ncbi:MAG: phage minor head protein [Candidatus Subteraquimicrobiales bacterium]|nr:phage minor head protein [Candidatus Subteraquimicrobiales bacterium]